MGNSEDPVAVKPEKLSSPRPPLQDQSNIHVHPDWTAMQAYYGAGVVPPYFNSPVASGQAPHPFMWGPPQLMIPPYGVPYPALYAHGGVYAHLGVPFAASPMSVDVHTKSSGTTGSALMKKLKGSDGLAMSIGNGNAESNKCGTEHGLSHSHREAEGSGDGNSGNSKKADLNGRKKRHEEVPNMTGEVKIETPSSIVPTTMVGKVAGILISPSVTSSLELKEDFPKANAKGSPLGVQQPISMIPNDSWLHNEQDLKREKRKQCNRESARRSRLRKQAEAKELAIKVHDLTAENVTIKSEINRLTVTARNLINEQINLKVHLKNLQAGQAAGVGSRDTDDKKATTLSTGNLLSKVNSAGSSDRGEGEDELCEKKTKSGAKLHQPRTDAVAAG